MMIRTKKILYITLRFTSYLLHRKLQHTIHV